MGVVMEPRDEESRQDFHEHLILPHREMPDVGRDIMDRYPGDTMLSKASLVDVVCLKTQGLVTPEGRVSRRHGLCIEHRNGAIDVLGQWDAADRTEVLWEEKTGGVLEAITFVYQNFGNPLERKVQSIHAERVDRAGVHKFVWDDATKVSRSCPQSYGRYLLANMAHRRSFGCLQDFATVWNTGTKRRKEGKCQRLSLATSSLISSSSEGGIASLYVVKLVFSEYWNVYRVLSLPWL